MPDMFTLSDSDSVECEVLDRDLVQVAPDSGLVDSNGQPLPLMQDRIVRFEHPDLGTCTAIDWTPSGDVRGYSLVVANATEQARLDAEQVVLDAEQAALADAETTAALAAATDREAEIEAVLRKRGLLPPAG